MYLFVIRGAVTIFRCGLCWQMILEVCPVRLLNFARNFSVISPVKIFISNRRVIPSLGDVPTVLSAELSSIGVIRILSIYLSTNSLPIIFCAASRSASCKTRRIVSICLLFLQLHQFIFSNFYFFVTSFIHGNKILVGNLPGYIVFQ